MKCPVTHSNLLSELESDSVIIDNGVGGRDKRERDGFSLRDPPTLCERVRSDGFRFDMMIVRKIAASDPLLTSFCLSHSKFCLSWIDTGSIVFKLVIQEAAGTLSPDASF